MNRKEFMNELRGALFAVSEEEREEALQYYNDYLDDAGVENEQKVLAEWESPEKLAESIRNGMEGKLENGEFTEQGFSAGGDKQCPAKKQDVEWEENRDTGKAKERRVNGWKLLALALLCIFLAPVCVPLAIALAAAVIGLLIAAAAVIAALFAVGAVLFAGGICVAVIGIGKVFAVPAGAAVLFGAGLLLTAVGALLMLLFGWALLKCSIALFKAFVNLCRRPFHGRRKAGVSK